MSADPSSLPTRRRRLPWFPIVTLLLGGVALTVLFAQPEMERNMLLFSSVVVLLVVGILNLLWFLVSPRFSWRMKLAGLTMVALVIAGLKFSVRVDGTARGTGLPRLAWKWTAKPPSLTTPSLPAALPETAAAADPARLAQAADVPEFNGLGRTGALPETTIAPDWNAAPPRELWRQAIGTGWSAFAVVGGRAYTQEQRGEDELVTCYDLLSGRLVWAHADKARFSQWQSGDGPHATPTVVDGKVFTYGGTGLLNCLDAATGQPVWQRSILQENNLANLEWGISASPLVVDGLVITTGGNTTGPVLFAYQTATGAPAWKAGNDRATYASPQLSTLAGKRVILCNHAKSLTAHDPATGAVLMEQPWGNDKWPKASQPLVLGENRIFVSAGYGMGCHLYEISQAPDGKLTSTESWANMKFKTQFNSAALRGDRIYGLDDGKLASLDPATGTRIWKDGSYGSGQTLLAGDLILVQNESGSAHLAAADPDKFRELGKVEALSSKTWNNPVLAGRYLLLRNDREAVCYELPLR